MPRKAVRELYWRVIFKLWCMCSPTQSYTTASFREQEDQKHQLQARFDEMKREVLAQGGDVTKMELPDIVITTDLTFKAATGTATVDRAKPLPRPLVSVSAQRVPQLVVFFVENITVLLKVRAGD